VIAKQMPSLAGIVLKLPRVSYPARKLQIRSDLRRRSILGLRIIAPTARIIPRIIWGGNRTQVRGMLFAKAPKPVAAVNYYGRRLPRPARQKAFAAVNHYGTPRNRLPGLSRR